MRKAVDDEGTGRKQMRVYEVREKKGDERIAMYMEGKRNKTKITSE